MYPGHFAAGLVIKTVEPRAPTLGLMIGVGALDLVFSALVPFGVEGGTLKHIIAPWSHSLVMAIIWSTLYALCFWRSGRPVVMAMAVAAMSHWVLDVLSHNPDMQFWPNGHLEFGFGPYFGGFGGWLELAVSLVGTLMYVRWARKPGNAPRGWRLIVATMAIMCGLEVAVAG